MDASASSVARAVIWRSEPSLPLRNRDAPLVLKKRSERDEVTSEDHARTDSCG